MSTKARVAKGKQIRDWHLRRRSRTDLSGLAEDINPTRLNLTPDSGPQEFPVDLPRTSDAQVQIVDVHPETPGTAPPGDQLAALSEIRFYFG